MYTIGNKLFYLCAKKLKARVSILSPATNIYDINFLRSVFFMCVEALGIISGLFKREVSQTAVCLTVYFLALCKIKVRTFNI